jgi:poly-gamma-glutamate synthesis protein (capsule biosynthesis protein)
VKILFAGDFFYDFSVQADLAEVDPDIVALFNAVDFSVINFEGALALTEKDKVDHKCALRQSESVSSLLKKLNVSAVCLANNHIFDHHLSGFNETQKMLSCNGVKSFGAGKTLKQSIKPLLVENYAFIAFSAEEIETKISSENDFGCAPLLEETIINSVKQLKNENKSVFVLLHWGSCYYEFPSPAQITLAKKIIDAGAEAIIGSHSHIVQGMMKYKNKPIIFSLGDFVFTRHKTDNGVIEPEKTTLWGIVCEFNTGSRNAEPVFYHVKHDADGNLKLIKSYDKYSKRFSELSSPFERDDYASFYRKYVKKRLLRRSIGWLNPFKWKDLKLGHLRGLLFALKQSKG